METTESHLSGVNGKRLFYGSCFAIITTALSFSIRAGILPQLKEQFGLSAEQLGDINSMWFYGFPLAMIVGGLTYHTIGPKKIMQFAFFAHSIGIIMTIYAGGYLGLIIATFLIGLGNGCTEAACNPMIADSYTGKRMNTLLNRFHMWFPGGIVIGALLSGFMSDGFDFGSGPIGGGFSWETQYWLIIIPTLIYAFLFWGQKFPRPRVQEAATIKGNLKALASPLFIFIAFCMALTAISEFVPNQWVVLILEKSGANAYLILALISGIMAVGRYFGGEFVHRFDQTGVLLGSSVLTAIGIFLLSTLTGSAVYFGAAVFALGICYFWPNMIGFVAEKIPRSGALGMSIVGAIGMFMTGNMQPIFGGWVDAARTEAMSMGLSGDAMELATGQETLERMIAFPATLIVLFTILWFWMKKRRQTDRAESQTTEPATSM